MRAIARWGWRLFRREWRQQILVLALLTAAVAAAIGLASATFATAPVPDNAQFGAASHLIRLSGTDPESVAAEVAAARKWFGSHEVIYHRPVPVPGLFEPVDYRTQDPNGALGGPRLALVKGAYPASGQTAITDQIAGILGVDIGETVDLDGVPRTVVGIVENPGSLADEFVLVEPSPPPDATEVTILANTSDEHARAFRVADGTAAILSSRQANIDVIATVSVLVLETVGLLLIALIAAASFVVLAHRRMRQLGMLAAIGATQRQLRWVTLTNGALIGTVAAIVGAVMGLAGWIAVAPTVEDTVGYRVDEFDAPLWLIGIGMLLAVFAGMAAAWWPARAVARVPPVRALSGRPPDPKPARWSAALAIGAACAGVVLLAMGGNLAAVTDVDWTHAALIVAGTVMVAAATLLAGPLAIRLLALSVSRFPIAVRLAVGDLARYRARSGAALAAISLAVGIAVAITAGAAVAQPDADEGNLPHDQLLIRVESDGPFVPEAADVDRLRAAAARVAASFDGPRLTSLDVALDPDLEPDPAFSGRQAITLAERGDDGWIDVSLIYVGTTQLLAPYGYRLDSVAPTTVVITRETGELTLVGDAQNTGRKAAIADIENLAPSYTSLPGTFTTTEMISKRGWVAAPSGRWLVELSAAPTTEQIAAARETAASAGLTVETRDPQAGLGALKTGATAAGVLVALGVVAMTVGLVRSEAGRDLRILTATGATRRTRRTLTAATAGGLATLGALLGTAGAYLGLTAGFIRNLEALAPVPIAHLAVIALGLPLIATMAGWLGSTRTITNIARQPLQ